MVAARATGASQGLQPAKAEPPSMAYETALKMMKDSGQAWSQHGQNQSIGQGLLTTSNLYLSQHEGATYTSAKSVLDR